MTNSDLAVRSIRIAATLTDRFGTIVRDASSIDQAQLELRIGEAQQIYPEIWRHLDEARTTLVERGTSVVAYDAVRATERKGQAIDNIDALPALRFAGELDWVKLATTTFNTDGHAKAVAACDALMKAMPEVDWKKLAQEEAATIAEAGSLKPSLWSWLTS